jgi:alkanesulfonate monooxygenase SsuD/methylene tetrahydromethanopterin reductase-like flavin-dependent oxidoreductase (luciferase family)
MHIGFSMSFQNLVAGQTDADVYRNELALADRAEAAGFDSVWTPEHHFTDYMMTPNVPQFLSWLAGRTRKIKLGTMVTVLPWNDPIRAAESFVLLDHLSEGRALVGVGRGLGRVEFDGFRLNMGESRQRFVEYSQAILEGLEKGYIEYDGELYKQPRVDLRPAPLASFSGRVFASAISPQSIDIMAKLGVGLLIFAQKPWDRVQTDLEQYRDRFSQLNGFEASKPIMCAFVGVSHDRAEAEEMRKKYIFNYARSTVAHYEFDNVNFENIDGYEYYGALARRIEKHGLREFNEFLADLQVWGTPQEVAERLIELTSQLSLGGLLIALSYGGMPADVATRNFDLFTREVLPILKQHDVGGDIGVRYDSTETAYRRAV